MPTKLLKLRDLVALDQMLLQQLCDQERISNLACYKVSGDQALLILEIGGHPSLTLPVHFRIDTHNHTSKLKTLLNSGWQPISEDLLKHHTDLRGWKAYFPIQDLWTSNFFYLAKRKDRKNPKTDSLDGFLEALTRRLHHWHATDEMRHLIDDAASQEHTHAFGSTLSQILSHELRNPLANLLSLGQTQELMGDQSSATQIEFASEVVKYTKQIWDIVQKIELLTDVDSNAFRNHEKPTGFNIISLIKSTIAKETKNHSTKDAPKVISSFTSETAEVHGVPSLVQLAIRELLKNAFEFSNGTPIKVGSFVSGESFILEVEEEGVPIAPGQEELIFLRYFQGSRGSKHKGPMRRGLGLGLFLARFVSSMHGGQLIFVRGRPGRKGLFRMILPLKNSQMKAS